jgi:hypothetical protein
MAKIAELKPKEWTEQEAYRSGRGGFRIKVGRDGNPFRGILGECWLKGWQDAAAAEPPIKRYVYAEDNDERDNSRNKYRGSSSNRPRNTFTRSPKRF